MDGSLSFENFVIFGVAVILFLHVFAVLLTSLDLSFKKMEKKLGMWRINLRYHNFAEEMSCEQLDADNFERRFQDFCFRLSLRINTSLKKLSPAVRDRIISLIAIRKWMFLRLINDSRDQGLVKGVLVDILVPRDTRLPLEVGLSFNLRVADGTIINPGRDTSHRIYADGSAS